MLPHMVNILRKIQKEENKENNTNILRPTLTNDQ